MTYKFLYRSIAESLYLSLHHQFFYTEIERGVSDNPTRNQEAMLKYFDYSLREGQKHGELFFPKGETYGASVWSKPMNSTLAKQISQEKRDFISQHLGETTLKKYMDIIEFMSEKAQMVVPAENWYLSIVGIAPNCQGKGLGSTIVKPVLEMADALGVPSYLETFARRNMNFYQRLGYMESASFIEPVTSKEYWIMIRVPLRSKHFR